MFKRIAIIVTAAAAVGTMFGAGTALAAPGVPLGGGSGIVIDDQVECTLTTIGHDNAGRLVGITAGHCGDAGAAVKSEAAMNAGVVGHFVRSNHNLDYAVIEFDAGKVVPINRVGNTTITGVGNPAMFPNIVCKEGRTSGNTCGLAYGDIFGTNAETWSQMCVIEGDSGAPVVIGSTLVGMVNAYLLAACIGPEVGTNFNAILGDVNAVGGAGAGYRPI
ncbi:serine protease [Antrihabitans cavernicola]|uniref:Serine protease n=1 Tax=Antrihabitans cavernicola TaxID=2495913 RepID=A0A5A7S5F3_9NOCA|nr:serine protease [Spelaeibacter cavernicola]KAA0019431.1 serine protease [Spelaeibacter cavernicola]